VTTPRKRPYRVVYLITASGMGGAEQQVRHLALAFQQRGWDVGVISMLPLEPPMSELEGRGIRTASLALRRGLPDPGGALRLRALLRVWEPDVLHAHMVHANLLARLSRLLVKTPVVISTIHNQDEGRQWRYAAYRMTDRLTDVTTAVSAMAVEESIRRGAMRRQRIVLVPNGIEAKLLLPDVRAREQARRALGLAGQFAWLAVGRLDVQKDYPTMLSAFARVLSDRPDAKLFIAGAGPLAQHIRTSIARAGLDQAVALLGLRSDVPALMQAADGFVLSSAWEGLPMVLLEAAASALPIVATDVAGSREVVIDGISGYLVAKGDDEALGRAMCKLMSLTQQERRALGEAGRDHVVGTFSLETIADAWEALYLALLRRAAQPSGREDGRATG
jgi:glycosyltransferase involved in cell wall biosynthesis